MTKLSWLIAPFKTVLRHCSSVQLGRYVIIFSHLLCSLEPIVVQYQVGIQLLYIPNYSARKITLYFTFGSCLCSKWNSIFTNSLHTANIYSDFLCTLAPPLHTFSFNSAFIRILVFRIFKQVFRKIPRYLDFQRYGILCYNCIMAVQTSIF